MHHIIYMSRAAQPFSADELAVLLAQARPANERRGVTGLLVYGEDQFLQVMEGEEAVLAALYARIEADPRHRHLVKMADKPVAQRSFPAWTMAFRAVSSQQFAHLAGYVVPAELQVPQAGLSAADVLLLEMARQFVLPPAQG